MLTKLTAERSSTTVRRRNSTRAGREVQVIDSDETADLQAFRPLYRYAQRRALTAMIRRSPAMDECYRMTVSMIGEKRLYHPVLDVPPRGRVHGSLRNFLADWMGPPRPSIPPRSQP